MDDYDAQDEEQFISEEDQLVAAVNSEDDQLTLENNLENFIEEDKSIPAHGNPSNSDNTIIESQDMKEEKVHVNLPAPKTHIETLIPVGPKISIKMKNFEMLSRMFVVSPNTPRSVMEDISEDSEMSVKDVKWTFIKLRHKFQHNKGDEVNKEAVQDIINTFKGTYQNEDYFVL